MKPIKLFYAASIAFLIAFALVAARGAYEYSATSGDGVAFAKTTVLVATPIPLTNGAEKYYERFPAHPRQTPMSVSVDPVRTFALMAMIASIIMIMFYVFNQFLRHRREMDTLASVGL